MAITASEARKKLFPLIPAGERRPCPGGDHLEERSRGVDLSRRAGGLAGDRLPFRSPANARRLLDAAAALDAGRGVSVDLDPAE